MVEKDSTASGRIQGSRNDSNEIVHVASEFTKVSQFVRLAIQFHNTNARLLRSLSSVLREDLRRISRI